MFSRFIYIVACICTSFFFMAEYYSIVWIYHLLFTHSSTEGYLSCFHFLVILNNAALTICYQVCEWTCVFISLGYFPGMELLGHFEEVPSCFPEQLHHLPLPPTTNEDFTVFMSSPTLAIICLFDCSHPSGRKVTSSGFDLHFHDAEHLFMCLLAFGLSSSEKPLLRSFVPF